MHIARSIVALALFALGSTCAHALEPREARGLWYDRAHAGHGVDVQQQGDDLLAIFYTFDADGEPEWYGAAGRLAGNTFATDLLRFGYDAAARPQQRVDAIVGRFTMRFDTSANEPACAGVARGARLAVLEANIDGAALAWCLEPLLPPQTAPEHAMNGTWWGGSADSGWGLTSYFDPRDGALDSAHVVYHYDARGRPRWAIAAARSAAFALETTWSSPRGYCRACGPSALVMRPAGSLALTLSTPRSDVASNRLVQRLAYPGPNGGTFDRDVVLARYSGVAAPRATIATREGLVAGGIDPNGGALRWLDLPFAQPPIGALRWRAPQPAAARTSVRRAEALGKGCPQLAGSGFFGAVPAQLGEDCLQLNVWVPDPAPATPAPVMVWIHGGGFIQGGATLTGNGRVVYDGGEYARRGIVFVSINYRIGALGFAAFRAMLDEQRDADGPGNFGFLDQVAALEWVRDNVAAFGGDPSRVTIFGESAGGVSVCAHLASPRSAGLFDAAIMQSGNCLLALPPLATRTGSREAVVEQGDRLQQRLGCTGGDVMTCLRSRSSDEILAAAQGATSFSGDGEQYGPVLDARVFVRSPGDAIATGTAARVPFIVGVNEDEATTLVPIAAQPQTVAAYEALVRARFPTIGSAVLARYPATAFPSPARAWTAIVTDTSFICPAVRAAREHARSAPAYAYYFTHVLPTPPLNALGAYHALDIPFVFVAAPGLFGAPEQALSQSMKALWSDFAFDGVPSASGVPAWPAHPVEGSLGLELNGAGIAPRAQYRAEYCGFWAQYVRL